MSLNRPFALIAIAALSAAGLALTPCATLADDETAVASGLRVADINATPARAGETTILTFVVDNRGLDPIHITGARLPDGAPSRVMGSLGSASSGQMFSVRVDPDQTERLDGETAWIEVGPLVRTLEADTVVPGRLLLGGYDTPITIRVVPSAKSRLASKSAVGVRHSEQVSPGC